MNEAIEFAEWLHKFYRPDFTKQYVWIDRINDEPFHTSDLYAEFNPSGAAWQAGNKTKEEIVNEHYPEYAENSYFKKMYLTTVYDMMEEYARQIAPPAAGPVWLTRNTGWVDKDGDAICEGDKLKHPSMDGPMAIFTVKWSEYRKTYIGDAPGEIYDLATTNFAKAKIVEKAPTQQVFTREQVEGMLKDTIHHFVSINGLPAANELYINKWIEVTLNTNYPS